MVNSFFKKFIFFALVCGLLINPVSGLAYDVDTHFYGTYSMARFAGIKHEIALKIATGTQWMDESYLSDPLSMILLPDVGIKKRRLLHFPGSRLANKLTVDTLPSFFDPSSGVKLKKFTETEADHEFATELFTEGLMQGDLMKAASGLHTLEDSFAHAGTISELGHAHFWHHPDRPYVDDESIEKYFKMTRSVLRAMVAIRKLLPMAAIDTDVKFGEVPNYQLNGDRLADIYSVLPNVRKAISRKILNEVTFVKFALEHVFQRAEKVKYIKNGYQPFLNNFTAGQDSYAAAGSIAKSLPPELVNLDALMKDSGRPKMNAEYIVSMGGLAEFTVRVIHDLLGGIVPRPMTAYHRFEKEEDGPVWIKEVELRVANMRALVYELYGKDIYFVKNNTQGEQGYLKELSRSPEARPVFPASNGRTEYVTYSLEEKTGFNNMIFSFLFPKLSEFIKDEKDELVKMSQLIIKAQNINAENKTLAERVSGGFSAVMTFAQNMNIFSDFGKKFSLAREDIMTAHLIPHENNRYYVVPTLLHRQIERGIFRPLLSPAQTEELLRK